MNLSATNPMAQALSSVSFPTPPKPGDLITGTVVNVANNKIIVEISSAYTGIIAGKEAIDGLGTAKELNVGDQVAAYVVEDENPEGMYVLSLRKAGREKAWDKLSKMAEAGEILTVRIKEANKGGLMTEAHGIRAFVPVSHLAPEHYPRVNGANSAEILRRLQSYVGETFTVKVMTVDKNDGKLILSEKEAISGNRATALKGIKVGQKVMGKVSGIVNFGLFILFDDCLEGLVHLSEIDWGHVTDPAAHARLGEEKEAVIIAVEGDKISLSLKRLKPDPWIDEVADLKAGTSVTGAVTKITSLGAFIRIRDNVIGVIPSDEIATEEGEAKYEVGSEVTAKVVEADPEEHRLVLTTKE